MKIEKAVVTAAGTNQSRLPLQRFVDRDGVEKTALQIIVEEVVSAGIREVILVIQPGYQGAFTDAVGDYASQVSFVEQAVPKGYGDALLRAEALVGGVPFLHLVSDHLYISREARRCAQQLVEIASAEDCAVSAVQPTRESLLSHYGTVGGRRIQGRSGLLLIEKVIEKPTPTVAEQEMLVPGIRSGHYLCFFGMHVLTPTIFGLLRQLQEQPTVSRPSLSNALNLLAARERYLATEINGSRQDLGIQYGTLLTQLALGLSGRDREVVLTRLLEMVASRALSATAESARG